MNLRSFLADQTGEEQALMVLNTTTNMGPFHVGLGVGMVQDGEVMLTPVGQACAERLMKLFHSEGSACHFVEVAAKNKLREKVRKAFLRAAPQDNIFFICGDDKLYDAVFAELNFQKPDAEPTFGH
jgi:hypothetical protein